MSEQMPEAPIPWGVSEDDDEYGDGMAVGFLKGAKAERELLWQEGYRKVPSEDEIAIWLTKHIIVPAISKVTKNEPIELNAASLSEQLHRWLMEER